MTPVKGDTALLLDTLCDNKRAFIYEGGHVITCNRRNECGYSSTLWDYVATRDKLTSSQETLQALARLAGYTLPSSLSTDALEALKRSQLQQTRLETAQALLTSRIFTDDGKKEREYLRTASRRFCKQCKHCKHENK